MSECISLTNVALYQSARYL